MSTNDPHTAVQFLVSGRVQGVFFRRATKQQADLYGLTGWVRNLSDGRVQGVVAGPSARVRDFIAWLQHGPELARVLKVETGPAGAAEEFAGFEIR